MCGVLALTAQKKPVTLSAVAAQPPANREAVSWSPLGKRFVYTEKNALMIYNCTTGSREQLAPLPGAATVKNEGAATTPFKWENRRVAGARPEWSSDERSLLYSRDGDVYLLDIQKKAWTKLADKVEDAHLAPDGSHVGFRRGNDLYLLEVAGRKLRRLTVTGSSTIWNGRLDWVYPEELGLGRAWWWSPDSRSIAYLEFDVSPEILHPHVDASPLLAVYEPQRYPKAGTPNADVRLGVVSARGGVTRWMNLGPTADKLLARVEWMPDSRQLAVQRLSRIQDHLELVAADVATGKTRVLLEEKAKTWVNVHDALRFLPDGRMLWASERDGYRHLYTHGADGKLERQLTTGPWEVTSVEGLTASDVYFTATRKSPRERHLYRLPLSGGQPRLVLDTPGTHTISMSPTGDFFEDAHSSLKTPLNQAVYNAEGAQIGIFRAADLKILDGYDLRPVENVDFQADGQTFHAQLIKPAGFQKGRKYPAIVMVYGGPHAQLVRDTWAGLSWDQALAAKGFVIWRMDNRGSAGRGHGWESPLYRRFGKVELADQLAGVKYLIAKGFVDEARIGIYGWSYGGYLTLYALANAPSVFAAGIAGAPVTNWRHYDTIYTERYLGLPGENEEGYRESSAITHAGKIKSPLLLVHNFEDDNVLFQNSQNMMEALQRENKHFDVMFYSQKSHAVTGPTRLHLLETTTRFFERELKP